MKTTMKLMTLALLALAVTSCAKEYTLTVVPNNADWGTVEGSGNYNDGETARIAAYPASGYYFISWQDGDCTNPREVVVTGDATYTAIFSNDPNGGGTGDPNDPTEIGGTINQNVTWVDRGLPVDYIVSSTIYLEGNALVTVEPGVCIMFANNEAGIEVGENAGLRMVGTQEKPIVLEGPTNNPNAGAWSHISILSNRSDNQFEYVHMINGGSSNRDDEGVVKVYGTLSMKHCKIDGSLGSGVCMYSDAHLSAFEYNEILNCAVYPLYTLYVEDLCSASTISTNNSFLNNGSNMICLASGSSDETALTFKAMSVPYYTPQGLHFVGDVTFDAGAHMMVANNSNLQFDGALVAQGTASNPIVFCGTGNNPSWDGIILTTSGENNVMSHCHIQNAGVGTDWLNQSCLYIGSETVVTLNDNVFGASGHYGVTIENIENWDNVTHSGNSFTDCASGNVFLESGGEYNGTQYDAEDVLTNLP